MSVTLTFSGATVAAAAQRRGRAVFAGALLGALLCASSASVPQAQETRGTGFAVQQQPRPSVVLFASAEDAFQAGYSNLRAGYHEKAILPLEFAARHDHPQAQYYLAGIYANNEFAFTNHGRAFDLFQVIVDRHASVDDDDDLAQIVAKSMIALARYYRNGITKAGIAPNLGQSAFLLMNAANSFSHEDGQYEYAKILLTGDGLPANPQEALRALRELSLRGHASSQAFLADLYWRGDHVDKDPAQALLLIDVAVNHAPLAERLWIEDTFQRIFCGVGEGVRKQAVGNVAEWRSKYGRPQVDERTPRDGLMSIQPKAVRTCSTGEPVAPLNRGGGLVDANIKKGTGVFTPAPMAGSEGGASGTFGLRDAGQSSLVPVPR